MDKKEDSYSKIDLEDYVRIDNENCEKFRSEYQTYSEQILEEIRKSNATYFFKKDKIEIEFIHSISEYFEASKVSLIF